MTWKATSSAQRSRRSLASILPVALPPRRSAANAASATERSTPNSVSKIITVLIYMNSTWEKPGGRLRLLRSGKNLNDIIVEVPPIDGTLLAFKRADNSWHGHEPFVGERRVIQFNWVFSEGNRQLVMLRHHASAWLKRMIAMLRGGSGHAVRRES